MYICYANRSCVVDTFSSRHLHLSILNFNLCFSLFTHYVCVGVWAPFVFRTVSEMMECMERVLARCRPEAVDNMDYQSMQSDDLSDQLVLYLVMPSRRVHSSSQQRSAPAASDTAATTGSTASSASAAKEGERCMEIVLDWINQLEPAFRRHSIQIQVGG